MMVKEKSLLLSEQQQYRNLQAAEATLGRRPQRSWLLTWIIVLVFIYVFWSKNVAPGMSPNLDHFPTSSCKTGNNSSNFSPISFKELKKIMIETPNEEHIADWSKYYTAGPHLAGKNKSQAEWTRDRWIDFGISAKLVQYDVYLHYPKERRLALLSTTNGKEDIYEANLEEDVLKEDGTSKLEDRVPAFLAYAASGNVTAQYVFVNYGTKQDYDDLVEAKVNLTGKIALAKYGGNYRGLKIKRAQELNMVGVVLYTDPGDDGPITEANGYKPYPEGPARNPSTIQRGSTFFLSGPPGDPTTIGYPSIPGAEHHPVTDDIPKIPALPISYREAIPLLKALHGHGPSASSFGAKFGEHWNRGGLGYKGVQYYIGPSPEDVVLNLVNDQEFGIHPIWDVIGTINGTLDDVVILGNHRDAWIAGGATDPNSGSSALNEVVRSFGTALKAGWAPLRTIVFASWDAEEYAIIGSTEWVEEFLPWLNKSAIAYLNVDAGTSGPTFWAAIAPLLSMALDEAASAVQSPNQTVPGQTIFDVWDKQRKTLGSGSDFAAFQNYAGVPCIDMGFGHGVNGAVFHYHSNYDSYHWMSTYGDPGWHSHAAMAKVWGLTAAILAETPVIHYNATDYPTAMKSYLDNIEDMPGARNVSFKKLRTALARLQEATVQIDAAAAAINSQIEELRLGAYHPSLLSSGLLYKVNEINMRYKYFERQFLYPGGLDNRHWYKHTIFVAEFWAGYAGVTFPGLVESLEIKDYKNFDKWSNIISSEMDAASTFLQV